MKLARLQQLLLWGLVEFAAAVADSNCFHERSAAGNLEFQKFEAFRVP